MIDNKLEKILLDVQKPGRYVGGELNSVIKDKNKVDVRFAFCFPDVYEIGSSHLGMKILYSLFNSKEYIWCERVFAPWVDMQKEMIKNDINLYALESKDELTEFDMIGFTLQYELSYSNVINMLNLANIPVKSEDRKDLKGLVVAGGPCACNPEPLADFIDLFFIGEGEEVDLEVIDLYRKFKKLNKTKREFLIEASKIEGVYVPSLDEVTYNEDGTIREFKPKGEYPTKIKKRIIKDLNKSYYPDSFVVPMIEIVHDRAVEEIFRGCIRGCRFCQAGFIYRPVREKSRETINDQAMRLCKSTGYDEVSLCSLSSSDYTEINELLDEMISWTEKDHVSVSLPSLRVDNFSKELTDKIKTVRKSGLTFAPEAGTQRMRDVINKNVTEEELKRTALTAFDAGWTNIKLYFMIGLPTETYDDIKGIIDLAQAIVDLYYNNPNKTKGKSVTVTVSVSSFIPKPFTPFQWEKSDDIKVLEDKHNFLRSIIKSKKINLNYHDARTSFLEAIFARGDRKLCKVLEVAQQRGLKFDGWNECFNFEEWMNIFKECNIDPCFYIRERNVNEILPWDHIDMGVNKEFLIEERNKAYNNLSTSNCRQECHQCGATCFKGGLCIEKRKNMV